MSYYSKWFDFKSSLGKSGESSDCAGLRLLANIMADEMKGFLSKATHNESTCDRP